MKYYIKNTHKFSTMYEEDVPDNCVVAGVPAKIIRNGCSDS